MEQEGKTKGKKRTEKKWKVREITNVKRKVMLKKKRVREMLGLRVTTKRKTKKTMTKKKTKKTTKKKEKKENKKEKKKNKKKNNQN